MSGGCLVEDRGHDVHHLYNRVGDLEKWRACACLHCPYCPDAGLMIETQDLLEMQCQILEVLHHQQVDSNHAVSKFLKALQYLCRRHELDFHQTALNRRDAPPASLADYHDNFCTIVVLVPSV